MLAAIWGQTQNVDDRTLGPVGQISCLSLYSAAPRCPGLRRHPRGDEPGQILCLSLYLPRSPPAPISQATYRVCPSICAASRKHPQPH